MSTDTAPNKLELARDVLQGASSFFVCDSVAGHEITEKIGAAIAVGQGIGCKNI